MSAKADALALIVRARDAWAAGDIDHAVHILDAASVRLEGSGFTRESMPVTFDLIDKMRGYLLGDAAA